MPLHDAYARLTPYELALPSPEFAEEHFPRIEEEAHTQGFPRHLADIRAFALLGEVGRILREIRPADDPPEMIDQYGLLLFHLFHFWKHGRPLYLVRVPAARAAVAGGGVEALDVGESGSVYLQLPQHLFWIPGEPNPESLDGVFVTWNGGEVTAVATAGVSRARGGVIAMPLPGIPADELPGLSDRSMRAGGEDFSTEMPGAEIDDLYGVQSAGEVLKLIVRLLPALGESEAGRAGEGSEGQPTPSSLSYRVLGGGP